MAYNYTELLLCIQLVTYMAYSYIVLLLCMQLVHPRVVIEGPNQTNFGSNVTIQCNVLEGYPLPSVSIITPRGQIDQSTTTFKAALGDTGNYICIANNSASTVSSNLSLTVNGKKIMT